MLNHPLFTVLVIALIPVLIGYLIKQLPAIREFPGRHTLVVMLTIEVVALSGIYGWWNGTSDKSDALKVLFKTVGYITLLIFVCNISLLVWMLWRTRRNSNSTTQAVNTTTLKTPDDWRRELLKAIEIDVTKRLCDSLHKEEIIRLQMENRKEEVGRSQPLTINDNSSSPLGWLRSQPLLKVFGVPDTQLEAGKPIIEVFDQPDIAGRLLILGAAGAGKTMMLLELTRDLIKRAEQQPDQPIPVLFELSNWKDDKQAIPNWLMADLKFRYNIPEEISCHWLDTDKLLPLLDGLDELGLARQHKCIERINEFVQKKSSLFPLVVCCREEEYINGEAILSQLRGAVCLQALTSNQIQNYLRRLGCFHLWQSIQDDPEGLGELAKMPLFLHLIPAAYPEGLVKQGQQRFNSANERQAYQEKCRQELFDVYINRRLEEHHDRQGYEPKDTKRWLKWLAKTLNKQKQKEFFIEKIQPSYLETSNQKLLYKIICGLLIGLFYALLTWLINQPMLGLILGLALGLLYGIFPNQIKLAETIKWSWSNFSIGMIAGLLSGLIFSPIFVLFTGLNYGWSRWLIVEVIVVLLSIMFGGGLINGLTGNELKTRYLPNQGIKESAKNASVLTLIFLFLGILIILAVRIIFGSAVVPINALLIIWLYLALCFGIAFGGISCLQHFLLRLIVWRNRSIPWNYARFLSYASERRFIQQVGGRYQFIHGLLQEHFAKL